MKSTQWFLQEWALRCSLGLEPSGYDQGLGVAGMIWGNPAKDDHMTMASCALMMHFKNCIVQLCPIQRLQFFFFVYFS